MQIANQVYKINTAANALAFFADGRPAYITKRFDYRDDGSKIKQDDFASIAGKTEKKNILRHTETHHILAKKTSSLLVIGLAL